MVYSIGFGILVGMPLAMIATLAGVLIGIWAVRFVFSLSFSDFRIVLVPSDTALLECVEESTD